MIDPHDAPALKILLVEDNPADARLVMELFRENAAQNASLRHAACITDALQALDDEDFDVILLDLSLPDGSGVVTVQRVRASSPHVPIVVLSGLGDEGTAIEAVQEGAQDYLVKSQVDAVTLVRAVHYAIGRHQRMHRIAYYDALTNLPNRILFRDRLHQALLRGRRYGDTIALLFIDLDGFKGINDSLGHEAGDAVLRLAARRMRESVRSSDVVARYGGDEFATMLPALTHAEDAFLTADKLRASIAAPHRIGDRDASVSASIGIALFPRDADDAAGLIQCADDAMYRAKRNGKNQVAFATP